MKDKRTSLIAKWVYSVTCESFALILLIILVYGIGITQIPDHPLNVAVRAQARVLRSKTGNEVLTIGGFDASRGASGSFPSGDLFTDARATITSTYPAVSFSTFSKLTQQALANLDILILSSATGENSAIVPLSNQEKIALANYVEAGGCAILLTDNDSFDPNASQANQSLIDPFGLVTSGTLSGPLIAMVPDPSTSPITSGPYGTISSFIQNSPGGLTDLGAYATSLATNGLGHALAVIESGRLDLESGPVVVFSDLDSLKNASAGGYFQSNRQLFLNTIAFCKTKLKFYLPSIQKTTACTVNKTTSGLMMEDENWCGDTLVTGSVEIPPAVNLTIQPGSTIRFKAQSNDMQRSPEHLSTTPPRPNNQSIIIAVFGVLNARGTAYKPIVFTSSSEVPGPRDWDSIAVEEGGKVNLEHVVLEYGYFGLQLNTPTSLATLSHSTIQHVTTTGIATGNHPINRPIVISDSQLIDCGREAIDTYRNQNFIIRHNVFSDNYVAIMSVGSSVAIESNLFTGNSRGIGIVENGDPQIIGNEFMDNYGPAIFVTDASPLITYNNMESNLFNIELQASMNGVTAENNWWGSTKVEAIEELIWDGKDDSALGFVDYEPYALEAFDLDVPEVE